MIGEIFVYSFIWSVGITGNIEGRKRMNLFIRDKIKEAEIEAFVDHYCALDPEEQLNLSNYDKFRFNFSNLGLANQERVSKNLGRSLFTREELSDFEELLAGFTN